MIEKVATTRAQQLHDYLNETENKLAVSIQGYWLQKAAELDASRLSLVYQTGALSTVDQMQVRQDVAEFLLEVMLPAWEEAYRSGGGQDHARYIQSRVQALQDPWTRDAIDALEMAAGVIVSGQGEGADHEMLTALYGLTSGDAVAVARYDANIVNKGLARRAMQYARQLLAQRAQRIASYEPAHARSHGEDEVARQAYGAYGYKKVWRVDPLSNVCDRCEELDGEEVEAGEEFAPGIVSSPLHPECRCSVDRVPRTF